jgi:methyl-accepting chemotaxis protein
LKEKRVKWFLDRRIQTKQILAFGAVVALTAFLGVFALLKLAAVRATTVDMSGRRIPAIQSLSELRAALMKYRVAEIGYVFTNDTDERELRTSSREDAMVSIAKAEAQFQPFIDGPEEEKLYQAIKQDVEQTRAETLTILDFAKSKKNLEAIAEVLGNAMGNFNQTMSDLQAEIDLKVKGAEVASKASATVYKRSQWLILGTLFVVVVLSVMMVMITTRLIAGPIRKVGEVLGRIATGDVTGKDLTVRSTDEIGELTRNINLMQRSLREMMFSISKGAEQIGVASKEFSVASQQITANSEETATQANVVSAATEQVNRNLQTVATSTEEMSATIQEIAKNATEAARVAGEALKSATETNTAVTKLGVSSGEISQVIKVITSIAQQTNLLALNATIEAARAGEAGRGFTVVANEVKELAKGTAKATDDIGRRIATIQIDTKVAVNAIATISGIIGRVNDISATIATAVQEQSATTSEMSRNLAEAAKGSGQIALHITGVAEAAQSTLAGTSGSLKAAQRLAEMSAQLHGLVEQFKLESSVKDGAELPV